MSSYVFSSESVCAGHPDKICDRISDALVDVALAVDEYSRVAVETLVTTNKVVMAGEVTCKKELNYERIARGVIRELGYTEPKWGFSDASEVEVLVHEQSGEIAAGVDTGGAGDQGLMFGYACTQTAELMPVPIVLAHGLVRGLDELREEHTFLRPDGKSQVSVLYEGRKPVGVETVVLAVPHVPDVSRLEVHEFLYKTLVTPLLSEYGFEISAKQLVVNGTGVWHMGGPAADTGVTGRKIVVDTYGGWARVGGGCFSGKDATKVDRSGAYAARWAAKRVVAQGLAKECEIQLAYVIGRAEPVSVKVETFGTAKKSEKAVEEFVEGLTGFGVSEILERFDLRKPQFQKLSAYGHMGRKGVLWEEVEVE